MHLLARVCALEENAEHNDAYEDDKGHSEIDSCVEGVVASLFEVVTHNSFILFYIIWHHSDGAKEFSRIIDIEGCNFNQLPNQTLCECREVYLEERIVHEYLHTVDHTPELLETTDEEDVDSCSNHSCGCCSTSSVIDCSNRILHCLRLLDLLRKPDLDQVLFIIPHWLEVTEACLDFQELGRVVRPDHLRVSEVQCNTDGLLRHLCDVPSEYLDLVFVHLIEVGVIVDNDCQAIDKSGAHGVPYPKFTG